MPRCQSGETSTVTAYIPLLCKTDAMKPDASASQILGRNVKEARLSTGGSQHDVAKLAGLHVTNFGKIERGLANPSLLTLVRLAAALGTTPAELLVGIDAEALPEDERPFTVEDFLAAKRAAEGK